MLQEAEKSNLKLNTLKSLDFKVFMKNKAFIVNNEINLFNLNYNLFYINGLVVIVRVDKSFRLVSVCSLVRKII